MRLERYLKRNKLSPEEFAEKIGVHATTVYRFLQGLSFPKSGNLRRIAEATNGSVKANDFMNVPRPPPAVGGRGRPRGPRPKSEEVKDGENEEGRGASAAVERADSGTDG